jgi:hypothetical protein
MPNAHDVANKYLKAPCGNTPYIVIGTGAEVRLYLWYFESQPRYEERWVEHRGRRRRRRYYHSATNKQCLSQMEPGETTTHSYVLPFQPFGTTVWLVYADTCNFNTATFTSPIWSFTYVPCTGITPYLERSHSINQTGSFNLATNVSFNTFMQGNPAMEFNSQFAIVLISGLYTFQLWATMRAGVATAPPSQTGNVSMFHNDGSTHLLASQNYSIEAARAEVPVYLEGRTQAGINDIFWLEQTITSPGVGQATMVGNGLDTPLMRLSGQA